MTLPLILLAAAITGGAIAYVVSPLLWREDSLGDSASAGGAGATTASSQLLARRDSTYAAILELDGDHALGKLDSNAYHATRAQLEDEAARVLQALDALRAPSPPRTGAARPHRRPLSTRRQGVAR